MMDKIETKGGKFENQLCVIDESSSSLPCAFLVNVPQMNRISSDYVHSFKKQNRALRGNKKESKGGGKEDGIRKNFKATNW